MSETVIRIENLSKYYQLGQINNGTLFRDIQTFFARKLGKPDPNAKIGDAVYDSSKKGFWALRDLTFDVKQGDRVGIIGKNGAGKSTLLKILSEITAPTTGDIKIKGRIASLLEVGTGFHPEMTGRENIYLNGAILGMKKKEIDKKLEEIIDFSEIEKHIDTPVKRYSSGMYVRLAFAIAAHLDSDILIADEVLAVGDATFQKKALGKMNDLSTGQGRTVLFVSHQMNAVKQLCNRGIVIEKGKLIRDDNDIEESIKWYMGVGALSDDIVTTSWRNDGSFKDDYFNPLEICIIDQAGNIVTEALDYSKDYKIRLKAQVNVVNPKIDYYFRCFIGTEMYTLMYMNGENNLKVGQNIIEFDIPAKSFLPNSNYIFSLGSSVKDRCFIVNPYQMQITVSTAVEKKDGMIFPSNVY